MLRIELSKKKMIPEKGIKLPNKKTIEEIKQTKDKLNSSGDLEELCNFEPDGFAFTPPDKDFMKHLQQRMQQA